MLYYFYIPLQFNLLYSVVHKEVQIFISETFYISTTYCKKESLYFSAKIHFAPIIFASDDF